MDFLRATTIEGNYPPLRRKNKSTNDSFMRTIGESFLTFFQQSAQLKSRPSLKESEETIQEHFKKMNEIIDSVDQHIIRRMQNHENEVFSIVKGEIEQMREETQKVVEKLNQAIKDKNTEDEIWKLSNQLDYFKSQTYKLFQENKQVRREMCLLRKQIKEYQIQLESSDKLMQKLKRKEMKALQVSKNKTMQLQKTKQLFCQTKARGDSHSHTKFKTAHKIIKTEPCYEREEKIEEVAKESIINIKVDSKIRTSNNFVQMIMEGDDNDPLHQAWTIPSEVAEEEEHLGISTLPPVNFLQVESSIEKESLQNSYHKVNRGVQTEPLFQQCESPLQKVEVKPLTQICAVESISMAKLKRQKQINFLKNGFHPVVYNKKSATLQANHNKTTQNMITPSSPSRRQTRHSRYMTNAFNKGKMQYEKVVGRRSGIKSTMK